MDTRREFLKTSTWLAAGAAGLPAILRQALAIDPAPGSTFLDAEHVVILMQENRSFDHAFGTLRGVRGFGDPRAVTLPDGNPVWLQTNSRGETYAPFPLDIRETRTTWMSCLPHGWEDQSAAANNGKHDRWLDVKRSGIAAYSPLPLTLGYHDREDLPFYYLMADAFTICDQNFCSSLTGTTPNRLFLWTGTNRADGSPDAPACVRGSDVDYDAEASWTTFPERLEDLGIPWRIYQNEISLPTGLTRDEENWLANFTDNPIEWFTQYHVRHAPGYQNWLRGEVERFTAEADKLAGLPAPVPPESTAQLEKIRQRLDFLRSEQGKWNADTRARLSPRALSLHQRAFTTNTGDPDYRKLETISYQADGVTRSMTAPKGDVLHQFRQDAATGQLPAVSWLIAPRNFSDHPDAPWYGAWYVAESLRILTGNPDLWRKTIFILCYDENDGYYDHVPPFAPPVPGRPETGRVPDGTDVRAEFVSDAQEAAWLETHPRGQASPGPVGLGFRVPLLIASPWSRGGRVCSQVFDHTSIVQFLEVFLSHKTGKSVREPQISPWRRMICGDLTAAFLPAQNAPAPAPGAVERASFLTMIHQAAAKPVPDNFHPLSAADTALARKAPAECGFLPRQEPGVRPSCAVPCELSLDATATADGLALTFSAGTALYGPRSAGAPFHVYAPGPAAVPGADPPQFAHGRRWSYAVGPGQSLTDSIPFADFPDNRLTLHAHGPNGFFRVFRHSPDCPRLHSTLTTRGPDAVITVSGRDLSAPAEARLTGTPDSEPFLIAAGQEIVRTIPLAAAHRWHDIRLVLTQFPDFERRWAGRIETGEDGISDPELGRT